MAKVAFITGATKGIGRAITNRLAIMGYDLFVLGRDEEALAEVVAHCGAQNVTASYLAGDLAGRSVFAGSSSNRFQSVR